MGPGWGTRLRRFGGAILALTFAAGALSYCSDQQGALELGATARFPAEAQEPALQMQLTAARHITECPNRADPGVTDAGDFLVLTVRAEVGAPSRPVPGLTVVDGEYVISTSPERFTALDTYGELAGGFDPAAGWECFSDEDLLPMLMTSGMDSEGLVVLHAPNDVRYVEFLIADAQRLRWDITSP